MTSKKKKLGISLKPKAIVLPSMSQHVFVPILFYPLENPKKLVLPSPALEYMMNMSLVQHNSVWRPELELRRPKFAWLCHVYTRKKESLETEKPNFSDFKLGIIACSFSTCYTSTQFIVQLAVCCEQAFCWTFAAEYFCNSE